MKRKQNAAEVYLQQWSPSTDTYKTFYGALSRIAVVLGGISLETFDWGSLRYSDVRGIGAKLVIESGKRVGEPLRPSTKNKMLSALRGVLESGWRLGQIPNDEYHKIKIDHERGKGAPAGRHLDSTEVESLLVALDKQPPRTAALLAILCSCGLRRIELVRLKRESYSNGRLTAYGKGNKERVVPVPPRWRSIIERWVCSLSCGEFMFSDSDGKPITRAAVTHAVNSFCESTDMRRFTPHDFRRTFITRMSELSDISIASKLAGHASIQTTSGYDRRDMDEMEKAVEKY